MDPVTIATAAVSLLLPFFKSVGGQLAQRVGQDLGDAARRTVNRLYDTIRARVAGDRFATEALASVAQQPDDQRGQGALQYALTHIVAADPAFGQALAALIEEAGAAGANVVDIHDAGAVAVGGDVTMHGTQVAGRDMTISGGQQIVASPPPESGPQSGPPQSGPPQSGPPSGPRRS
jgi:hypothetical protein